MARLRLKWNDITKFDKPDPSNPSAGVQAGDKNKGKVSGKDKDKAEKDKLLPLPLLVYISTTDRRAKRITKLVEKGVLEDERVALGAHFFRTIKLRNESLDAKHPLAKLIKGRQLPRIVLVPRDRSRPIVLEGKRIKASSLYRGMCRVSDKFCKQRLDRYVNGMRKILNELDKLDVKKKKYSSDKRRGRARARDKKEIDQLEKLIEKAEAKLTNKKFRVDPELDKPKPGGT